MDLSDATRLTIRYLLSAGIVVLISEFARRSTLVGGLIASLPLTSLLALVWLYRDTGDGLHVAALSMSIFWLVLPSLLLFVVLAVLLRHGTGFGWAMALACTVTVVAYGAMLLALRRSGISL